MGELSLVSIVAPCFILMKMKALLKINETIDPSPSHYHGLYIRPYQSNFLFDIPGFQLSDARVSHTKLGHANKIHCFSGPPA